MRTEEEMMALIKAIVNEDARIRMLMLEGSRTNVNIAKDEWQDYDITFFTHDIASFLQDESWLKAFGEIIMMQRPEAMELFPAEEKGYSYLMMLDDYNKVDLTLMELENLKEYLAEAGLTEVLIDKDGRMTEEIIPTDEAFHVRKPTSAEFDDSCNEFWHVTSYVVKGLCRGEILYAIDHLNGILRPELLRMLSWKVGAENGFSLSVGKNYKFIDRYMAEATWDKLLESYNMGSIRQCWESLFIIHELFRETSREVAELIGCTYPYYDENMSRFTEDMYKLYGKGN